MLLSMHTPKQFCLHTQCACVCVYKYIYFFNINLHVCIITIYMWSGKIEML